MPIASLQNPIPPTEARLSHELQNRHLGHLHEVAKPRHAAWDRLGLMAVRSYLTEHLSALGYIGNGGMS